MAFSLKKFFAGDPNEKTLRALDPIVARINDLEGTILSLSDEELRVKTREFQTRLQNGETLDVILPEAFAVVREASKRTLGLRHFDVQLVGGIIMHQGNIAEMRTGEGKTLVATLPAYLNALTGKGVHIVTVNDYLASRDAAWMGQIYAFLGLTVGVITSGNSYLYDRMYAPEDSPEDQERDELGYFKVVQEFLRPATRREAYEADVTYGTNNEFGFDYLRDNISYSKDALRQRGHNFAIVDEIDSVLIDEARTPLIISAPAEESHELYKTFAEIARTLKRGEDYEVDEKLRAIELKDSGIEKAEKVLGVENLYTDQGVVLVHHLETAVRAEALYERDKEYVVKDGEVMIVDEFTGRILPGRRYSEGLHQALEAKEGVELQKESRTYASITYQNFFKLYNKLAGMTGTAMTSQEEFYKVYGLDVIAVPTNVPIARIDHDDLIFQTEVGKFKAIARKVKELNKKGQPVLIGTVSIEKNEMLGEFLKAEGIKHEILNAKNHAREGEIIARAGHKGAVTIATNMAGRGVDIKLGGEKARKEEYEEVKKLGGLFVLGTERHSARRIDNQLRGRSGRQGDPGETQFYVSLEDDLMRIFASGPIKTMMGKFGIPEDEPIENKMITRALENAQQKIEGMNFDARRHVLQYDNVLNKQRKAIYERRMKMLVAEDSVLDEEIERLINTYGETQDGKPLREIFERKREELGELFYPAFRRLSLQSIDMLWVEHLEEMDYLRGSVRLRAYGQRDPLIEYQKEGLRLFNTLEGSIDEQIIKILPNVVMSRQQTSVSDTSRGVTESRGAEAIGEQQRGDKQMAASAAKFSDGKKIGRNDVVVITNGSETQEMKFKKAQELLSQGWRIVEEKEK